MKINVVNKLIYVTLFLILLMAGCSRRTTNYVGMVNDRYITKEEYMTALRSQFEAHYRETGFAPDELAWQRMSQQAFKNIVDGIIFQEQLNRYNITVSHREVIDYLLENVPDVILESRQFSEKGEFNQRRYRESLQNNNPVDLSWMVSYHYDVYLPLEKLRERVLAGMNISDDDILQAFMARNSSATATIIGFNYDKFDDVMVTERDVQTYYYENRFSYLKEPYAVIQYAVFPLEPSQADISFTKTVIDSVYQELEEGLPFPILAGTVSDSPTAIDRGEMAFVELDSLSEPLRSNVARLEINQYTRPYEVENGWAVYQLMAKTRSLVKLREIFIRHKASPSTRRELNDRVVNIRSLAQEVGLERAADEFEVEVHTSGVVTPQDPHIDILGKSDSIVSRAIAAEPGTIFEPVFHNMLQAYVLITVLDSQQSEFVPRHQVAEEIREKLELQRKKEQAERTAQEFRRRNRYNRIMEQAEAEKWEIFQFDLFSANSYLPNVNNLDLATAMFSVGKDRFVSEPVVGGDGVYIGVVHRFFPADKNNLTEARKRVIREDIYESRKEGYFENWMKEKRENARIKDWRHRL